MKILIVDDNDVRLAKIVSHLQDKVGIAQNDIVTAVSGLAARKLLAAESFDLLVLDVILRRRPESVPESATSLDLLVELAETTNLRRPGHIIGITAYQDVHDATLADFERYSWRLLRANETSDEYLLILEASVRYLIGVEERPPRTDHLVDLIVVTALASEMDAFQRDWEWEADQPFDDTTYYRRGKFTSKGRSFSVAAVISPRMGMVAAGVLISKLVHSLRPRLVVMPGICAGIEGRADIGDVVFAETCWDYQSGKHVTDSGSLPAFLVDPHFVSVNASLCAKWDQLAKDSDLILRLTRAWPAERRAMPTLRRGPIATGSAVLADARLVKGILQQHRKALGVEMELYGIYSAVETASRPRPLVCGMKAVCDFADHAKDDNAQPFAAYISAAVTRAFLERYMADLCNE